jgi:hypothetical protein
LDEPERLFTLEEANAMLPDLRDRLTAMREARGIVMRNAERVRGSIAGNGGGKESAEYSEALGLLKRETERLSEEGVILRDVETGLVDFPAEREGQRMFLCWKMGEPEVAFWHPVDTGIAGRRPV